MFNTKKPTTDMIVEKTNGGNGTTLIGSGTTLKGDISSNSDLRIDGTIIGNISSNAKQADVAFNALTFSLQTTAATSGQGGQAVPTVTVSASFQGPSENIMRFLQLIENNPRKMVVKDAGVSTADSIGGAQPLVNLNLTLQAFYRNNVQ